MKLITLLLLTVALSGCIANGPAAPEEGALLKTNYPIVKVDGEAVDPAYEIELKDGLRTVTVVYYTYRWNYYCHFEWQAEKGQRYEITDSENVYPLTLYRWVRRNALWAIRYDPTHPQDCEKQPTS